MRECAFRGREKAELARIEAQNTWWRERNWMRKDQEDEPQRKKAPIFRVDAGGIVPRVKRSG